MHSSSSRKRDFRSFSYLPIRPRCIYACMMMKYITWKYYHVSQNVPSSDVPF